MGRIIGIDKIGTLSHSAGVITLGPSLLTIGGQQFRVLSSITRTISTDITMAANTRYQVFAVMVGGVVQLRISANENSAGPAGFSSWKLVGSFYANGMGTVAFGSFVNIEGPPSTNTILHTPAIVGMGTLATNQSFWRLAGDTVEVNGIFTAGTIPVAVEFRLPLPIGMTAADDTRLAAGSNLEKGRMTRYIGTGSTNKSHTLKVQPNRTYLTAGLLEYTAAINPTTDVNSDVISGGSNVWAYWASIPIQGGSIVPLKDR
jgi:hypothetical protein